jgi:cation diffusion facilitator CzcD-associated flavoprotein CzcO
VEKYVKLNIKVEKCVWDNERGIWRITLRNTLSGLEINDWAHVLINGTGILNTWTCERLSSDLRPDIDTYFAGTGPDIDGLKDFRGPVVHSADWNHKVDYAGKSIGLIGKGSSAVQIVPQVQKSADIIPHSSSRSSVVNVYDALSCKEIGSLHASRRDMDLPSVRIRHSRK